MNTSLPPPPTRKLGVKTLRELTRSARSLPGRVYNSVARRLFYLPARFLRACGFPYRVVTLYTGRIGHLAIEPDLFLKEGLLGMRPPFKALWLASRNKVVNRHLLEYWAPFFHLVRSPWLARLMAPLARLEVLGYDNGHYAVAINDTAAYPKIQSAWGVRPPLLRLTPEDDEWGRATLKKLGVPEGAWFVCVHCREAGYMRQETIHSYRDADIMNFLPAMAAIVERGGWCIRVGDKSMKPLPRMAGVVDYALLDIKSERMDVFLCAACKCFLGSSSGMAIVSSVFGVPAAMTNVAPMSAVLPFGNADLGIPKLLWSAQENRLLPFPEILGSPAGNFRFAHLYEQAGLKLLDNSPDEIRELAVELLEAVGGTVHYSPEDERLQQKFKSLMRPGHYSHGARSRVGRYFLSKHAALLGR